MRPAHSALSTELRSPPLVLVAPRQCATVWGSSAAVFGGDRNSSSQQPAGGVMNDWALLTQFFEGIVACPIARRRASIALVVEPLIANLVGLIRCFWTLTPRPSR